MYGKRVLEIAVYRKDPEKLVADLNRLYLNRSLTFIPRLTMDELKAHPAYNYFWEGQGNPYPYNQVVGWIVLWTRSDSILGECYAVNGQRINHACKKLPFQWLGRAFDVYVFDDDTDTTIPVKIREEMKLLTKSGTFKNRWIDLEAFDNLAPYIRWCDIVDESIL